MNRGWALGLCLIAAAGLALRCARLDNRPMHNDEAVNATKLSAHWGPETYRYDPHEYHGPTLYYGSLLSLGLSDTRNYDALSVRTLRLTPALFGVGLIFLLWPMAQGLGRSAALVAGSLTALSPAMLFYSRYYIHETLLVFFTFLALIGGWRFVRNGGAGWAALAGFGVGLMYATKETFIFSLAAMLGAWVLTAWMDGRAAGLRRLLASCRAGHLCLAAIVALGVSQLLFTSFLTNVSGPLDSLKTYLPWLRRAGGESPHLHPWFYYLELLACSHQPKGLVWTEALILGLAVVGGAAALTGRWLRDTDVRLARFLTFYTVGLTLIYSAISYKTPWCALGFLHGFILLAGIGAVALHELARPGWTRVAISSLLLVATAHLAWLSWQTSFVRFADWRNPYAYAQTLPDVLRMTDLVKQLSNAHPDGDRMMVKVVVPEDGYWPLPYYLRSLRQVGWYATLPEEPFAPVIIADARLEARLDEKSDKRWLMAGMFELRPRIFLELYVELELWKRWLETRPPIPDESDDPAD